MHFVIPILIVCIAAASCQQTDNYEQYDGEQGSGEMIDIGEIIHEEVQKVVYGMDHTDLILSKLKRIKTKHGKCIEDYGPQSRYDLENKHCFNCSIESCDGNPMRLAICQDYLLVFGFSLNMMEDHASVKKMEADIRDLNIWRYLLTAAVCILAFVVIFIGFELYKLRKYRFNKTTHPEGDELPGYNKVPKNEPEADQDVEAV